jgi:hypothetical protein
MIEKNISTTKSYYTVIINDKGLLFDSRQRKCYDRKINAHSQCRRHFSSILNSQRVYHWKYKYVCVFTCYNNTSSIEVFVFPCTIIVTLFFRWEKNINYTRLYETFKHIILLASVDVLVSSNKRAFTCLVTVSLLWVITILRFLIQYSLQFVI